MTTLLAGDIGGTKTLLATYRLEEGALVQLRCERFASAAWDDFSELVRRFLAAGGPGSEAPGHGCLAIAGPVQDGRVRLTNLPWELDELELASACGLERLELVNDFAVLIYGLPHLGESQQVLVRQGLLQPGPLAILGAGTGLGVAVGVPGPRGLIALASEAAHAEFAPRQEREWRLKQWLLRDLSLERVSIERIVSGTGLGHVFRWFLHEAGVPHGLAQAAESWALAELRGEADRPDLPALVAAAAAGGDPLAAAALDLWLGAYGSVAGDLALQSLCRGGLWLGGGTAAKLLPQLRSPAFLAPFAAKGRLTPVLEQIPLRALIDPEAGLFSAACRARMLLA
ncbi:glucokinase [Synechococcus sp. CBW1107]|uniref:glucokinase n=1 Tax=Synechococcus sp. CBW1107 TaxID=2789857 RepID=UPI0018CDCAC0|nr:glucokinase [Synechococcus sp. CBW1107]QPN56272.1 glucokinase [Synechococcus sp. CBW1107]CAK6698309.1 Glucokinase [Synechococcus sp. CBW1107]